MSSVPNNFVLDVSTPGSGNGIAPLVFGNNAQRFGGLAGPALDAAASPPRGGVPPQQYAAPQQHPGAGVYNNVSPPNVQQQQRSPGSSTTTFPRVNSVTVSNGSMSSPNTVSSGIGGGGNSLQQQQPQFAAQPPLPGSAPRSGMFSAQGASSSSGFMVGAQSQSFFGNGSFAGSDAAAVAPGGSASLSSGSLPSAGTYQSRGGGGVGSHGAGSGSAQGVSKGAASASTGGGQRTCRVGEYELGADLGTGTTSHVRLCRHLPSGQTYAAKIIPRGNPEEEENLKREVRALSKIDNEHVIKYRQLLLSSNNFYVIMEAALGGDLLGLLLNTSNSASTAAAPAAAAVSTVSLDSSTTSAVPSSNSSNSTAPSTASPSTASSQQQQQQPAASAPIGVLPISEVRRLFGQLVRGLTACHMAKVAHRDIKPDNILITRRGDVKLSDFNCCKFHNGRHKARPEEYSHTFVGTIEYAAPEVIAGGDGSSSSGGYDGFRADMWSLGCVLHAMLSGRFPFGFHVTKQDQIEAIRSGEYVPLPPGTDPLAVDLVARLIRVDPAQRLTCMEVLNHDFLRSAGAAAAAAPAAAASVPQTRRVAHANSSLGSAGEQLPHPGAGRQSLGGSTGSDRGIPNPVPPVQGGNSFGSATALGAVGSRNASMPVLGGSINDSPASVSSNSVPSGQRTGLHVAGAQRFSGAVVLPTDELEQQ